VIRVTEFEVDGMTVNAPGFAHDQFVAFVDRARRQSSYLM
jgi:hypothetical protein